MGQFEGKRLVLIEDKRVLQMLLAISAFEIG
jgi:hypothetical protein